MSGDVKFNQDTKKKNIIRICILVGFIICVIAVAVYDDIQAKKFKGFNLKSVSIYMPKEYYSEPSYYSNGLLIINNSKCFVIAIDLDNVSEQDKEVCNFIAWDKVNKLYEAKNVRDVAYAIQLLSPMFSYHRYVLGENKHSIKQYLYMGDNNGPGQIEYYTSIDPDTHVIYALFDHDKNKVFSKDEYLTNCIYARHN